MRLTAREDHAQLRGGEVPPFIEAMYSHGIPVISTLHAETHLHVDWRLRIGNHLQCMIEVYVLHVVDTLLREKCRHFTTS